MDKNVGKKWNCCQVVVVQREWNAMGHEVMLIRWGGNSNAGLWHFLLHHPLLLIFLYQHTSKWFIPNINNIIETNTSFKKDANSQVLSI